MSVTVQWYNFIKLMLLTCCAGAILWLAYLAGDFIEESTSAVKRLAATAERIDRVAQVYEEQLASERSRKAIQASIEAAAAWKATAMLVNTTTIPQINKAVIELQKSARSLGDVTSSVDKLVKEQNENVSTSLSALQSTLTATEGAVKTLDRTIGGVGTQVEGVAQEAGRAATVLTGGASELALTAQSLRGIAEEFREAARSAPGTAKAVERIATSSSKWQTALRVIQIVATLGVLVK